jgi:hypothetical protein
MTKRIITLFAPALLAVVCAPLQAAISTQLFITDGVGDSVTLEWNTTNVPGCPAAPSFCELTTGTTTTGAATGIEHGTFTFVGTIGTFSFNETTGRGQNAVTLPTLMNVSSIDATSTVGGGTLSTTFTDADYTGLRPALNLSASNTFTAGTANGSTADFSAFGDSASAVPGGTLIGDLATFTQASNPNGQSDSANNNFANTIGVSGSLSEVVTLHFTGAGEIDSGFTIANGLLGKVPEPTSVIFLGTMVVGLAGLIRKKQAKRV